MDAIKRKYQSNLTVNVIIIIIVLIPLVLDQMVSQLGNTVDNSLPSRDIRGPPGSGFESLVDNADPPLQRQRTPYPRYLGSIVDHQSMLSIRMLSIN
jgi:hypothetical protein